MYARPPTQSTLYQTFTKHYSVVANSLTPTTQPYDKHEVNFYDSATINITERAVLTGYRCPRTGLWRIPLRPATVNDNTDTLILDSKCGLQSTHPRYHVPTPTHIREHLQASLQCNTDHILNVYELPSIEQSIRYLHAAAGFPTKSTWLAAIRKGNYSTWPLITVKNAHKHFPQSEETQQGHMRNQRQGTRSTKQALPQAEPRTPLPQLHDIFIRPMTPTAPFTQIKLQLHMGRTYQEQNRRRTHPSTQPRLQRMKACGIQPTRQVLDNEISAAYKLAITASGMTYQLVPPDDHRRNIAEKAIQTWKDHFIAAISGTDAKFPSTFGANYYHKWNANSAFYGNPMHTPTFPPIRISTAIMTTTHTLSSPGHGSPCPRQTPPPQIFCPTLHQGYVIGTSHEHYRCWKVWTPTSSTTRISATVFFKHKYITNPSVTPADAIIAAAANLSHLLTNNLQAHHNNKPYSTPTLENSSSIATSSKPKIQHHMEKCIWQRTRSPRPRYPRTVKGTNTIVFIAHNEIPPQRRRHLRTIAANYRPEKDDPYRIRLTVGGNRITYPGDRSTPTADMLTTKTLLNSAISTKGARFMTIDIKDFYLNTPMVRPEYMRLKLSDIPTTSLNSTNLTNLSLLMDTPMS
eukprot:CCRYP_004109-RA/>CCRYP_004109-RA protein AED:0.25 eAED:0.31 QI:0/0/0/1/0.33/0.25/4/0/631